MDSALLSADVRRLIHLLAEHELTLPALCFVASHRPLAFALSHLLHVVAPLALLLGQKQGQEWALLLGSPTGLSLLEEALVAATTNGNR